jgi:ankyrin repeat protein
MAVARNDVSTVVHLLGAMKPSKKTFVVSTNDDHQGRAEYQQRDTDVIVNGTTALIDACIMGNMTMARALIAAGADVNAAGVGGWTPLMWTSTTNRKDVACMLIRSGACVDAKNAFGRTPLMIASSHGNIRVVRALLDAGADVSSVDINGWSAMMHTANHFGRDRQRASVMRALLTKILTQNASLENSPSILPFMLASPLMIAAMRHDHVLMHLLLHAGADPSWVFNMELM